MISVTIFCRKEKKQFELHNAPDILEDGMRNGKNVVTIEMCANKK